MSEFLPDGYDVPSRGGNYMKFEQGENRFRILSSPIVGWECWTTTPDGARKPLRTRMNKPFELSEIDDPESVKHFWAMPIYNYKAKEIQILEITQKGIQRAIKALTADPDWGSPLGYDLVVNRKGEGMETEYQVMPKPAKELEPGIKEAYQAMKINLEALYTGDDPFSASDAASEDKIDLDEAEKAISQASN